jgi:DNA-binding transcriptional MocR family regulator
MRLRSSWTPRLSDRFTSPADRLVGALADDILEGTLETGTRLPAHRDLADTLGIGVGTVTKAYAILERRGLIRTAKGSGTFVALTHARKGAVIDLSRNVPPAALSERVLARTLTALAKRVDSGFFNDYPPPGGHREHRQMLARWFASIGMQANPELLLLTGGAHQAVAVAFTLACGDGGTLFTEMHTYPGAIALARRQGLKLVGVEMDAEGILPDALDHALRTTQGPLAALYVTPTMHNPTTATMSLVRREAVVAVCRTHDIAIIEDDVYNLGIDPELIPLAMLAPERTFYANSMSKSLTPTLRIGGLVVPSSRLKDAEGMFRGDAIILSPLNCALMEQWLIDGTADAINQAIQGESKRRMALAKSLLGKLVCEPAYPGYHLWMPMASHEAERLHQAAAAFGIRLTHPDATAASTSAQGTGIRLCIGAASLPDLSSALATIARLNRDVPEGSGSTTVIV